MGGSSARAGRSIRPPLSGLCAYAAPRAFAARDSTSEAAPVSVPLDRGDDFQGPGCLNRRADHRPESSRRFRHRGPRASLRPSHGCSGSANEEEAVMFGVLLMLLFVPAAIYILLTMYNDRKSCVKGKSLSGRVD